MVQFGKVRRLGRANCFARGFSALVHGYTLLTFKARLYITVLEHFLVGHEKSSFLALFLKLFRLKRKSIFPPKAMNIFPPRSRGLAPFLLLLLMSRFLLILLVHQHAVAV